MIDTRDTASHVAGAWSTVCRSHSQAGRRAEQHGYISVGLIRECWEH